MDTLDTLDSARLLTCVIFVTMLIVGISIIVHEYNKLPDNPVPLCPDAGISYYETDGGWTSDEKTVKQFQEHGWKNVRIENRHGALSSYTVVTGECKL